MDEIIIKYSDTNIKRELEEIGFDSSYISYAVNKYKGCSLKIFKVKPHEANILKQLCLSLGFDCAVNRNTVMCKCDYTDCLIFASISQLRELCIKLKKQPFRLNKIAKEIEKIINSGLEPLEIREYLFDWSRPYIMGVLNTTPDSFSDGGFYNTIDSAFSHAVKLIEEGADIIDIGGESTRPGAAIVTTGEEIQRVIPVIEKLRKHNIKTPISVDTRNYETAKAAIEAGADIINDVSGFDYDKKLFEYICKNNIPAVIMHSDKVPAVSEDCTVSDIIEDIYVKLNNKIKLLCENGMQKSKIIADTGIGFGKSKQSCFEILKRHSEFTSLQVPLLLGISRKSFIRNEFNIDYNEADTVTALYSAMTKSVNIHRVHNAAMVKKYINYASSIS